MKAWNHWAALRWAAFRTLKNMTLVLKNSSRWSSSFYIVFGTLLLFPVSCNYETASIKGNQYEQHVIPPPVSFDLDRIKKRGSLIAIIDNSSTSYFIYRGQPMGYEYELLNLLAKELEVQLELLITTDVEEAMIKLNTGEGDLIAHSLPVTTKRKEYVAFTEHHNEVRQVLVQRKPKNWQKLSASELDQALIRNPLELGRKTVYVKRGSAYEARLHNMNEETGGNIKIYTVDNIDTE